MSFAHATIYAYIAFAGAGALVFHTLCRRGFRRAEAERRRVTHPVPAIERAA